MLASTGDGQATLKVGSQAFQVRTTTPLHVGERLNLEVTHAGRLLVLARREDTGGSPRAISHIASNILRQKLPVQRSLGETLGAIVALAEATPSAATPRDLRNLAQQLLGALPPRETLTNAAGVARALQWASSRSTWSPGLASALGKALEALPSSPGRQGAASPAAGTADEHPPLPGQRPVPQRRVPVPRELPSHEALRQQLQGASARVDLLALTAMFPRARERAALAAEIPLVSSGESAQVDVIGVRIAHEAVPAQPESEQSSRHARDEGEARHRWRVELAFDLPGLGPLNAVVKLSGKQDVAVRFRSREAPTAQYLQGQLPELDRRLLARGLSVQTLLAGVDAGAVDGPGASAGEQLLGPMVDERV